MKHKFLFGTIIPTADVDGVGLIMVSTLSDRFNHFTRMINQRLPDGSPAFNVFRWQAVCETCAESDASLKMCEHMRIHRPYWLSADKSMTAALFGGNLQEYAKELGNVDIDDLIRPWFNMAVVERMQRFDDMCVEVPSTVHFNEVIIGIDPASGGKGSEYAIVALVRHGPKVLVSITHQIPMEDRAARCQPLPARLCTARRWARLCPVA